jgi:hypothetical protein
MKGPLERAARICALLCLLLPVAGLTRSARAQTTADEYQIKAAFLFHFAQLVEWPAGSFSGNDSPINLCVYEDEAHRQELQNAVEGKRIGARVLHLRLLGPQQEMQGCNILFLGREKPHRQTETLRGLRGQPVLTVGESASFLSDGGMIRFHLEDGKIRFDINLGAANLARIKISSRLLLLASTVERGNGMDRGR